MKLSENAKAPTRATKGSIGYDIYSVVYRSISPSEYELVATVITLIPPPGVYPKSCSEIELSIKKYERWCWCHRYRLQGKFTSFNN